MDKFQQAKEKKNPIWCIWDIDEAKCRLTFQPIGIARSECKISPKKRSTETKVEKKIGKNQSSSYVRNEAEFVEHISKHLVSSSLFDVSIPPNGLNGKPQDFAVEGATEKDVHAWNRTINFLSQICGKWPKMACKLIFIYKLFQLFQSNGEPIKRKSTHLVDMDDIAIK